LEREKAPPDVDGIGFLDHFRGFLCLACDSRVLRGVVVLQDHRLGRRFCVTQIETD
jgi:hypothetical protein